MYYHIHISNKFFYYVAGYMIKCKGGVPPYMEFTWGSANAQNCIKFCRKIVFYMCVLFVRYLPIHLFQLLNLNNFKFQN